MKGQDMGAPIVMVSSTFYDLRQIRADLAQFLVDQLGYQCLLSELPSFPVDPDLDTIANCRKRVEDNADVLVLVVGGRYGSLDEHTDKSITNLEYLTARHKGIPVYTFVAKNILDLLPVWERNPTAEYGGVVDTPRLFHFVEEIRQQHKEWVFAFETAQDIVSALRTQFAHLFSTGLTARRKIIGSGLPDYFEALSPSALRIALEKPDAWEYRLFLQAWCDEVRQLAPLAREYDSGIVLGRSDTVKQEEALDWMQTRLHELMGLAHTATHLVNVEAMTAFGEPGVAGDAEHILWVARKLGLTLRDALEWALRIRRAWVADPFRGPAVELSQFAGDVIQKLSATPFNGKAQLEAILSEPVPEGGVRHLEIPLTLNLDNLPAFEAALEAAGMEYIRARNS